MQADKHQEKVNNLQAQIDRLTQKYPSTDLTNQQLFLDINKFHELQAMRVHAALDLKACKSENENFMCSTCDCWKQTRNNCM